MNNEKSTKKRDNRKTNINKQTNLRMTFDRFDIDANVERHQNWNTSKRNTLSNLILAGIKKIERRHFLFHSISCTSSVLRIYGKRYFSQSCTLFEWLKMFEIFSTRSTAYTKFDFVFVFVTSIHIRIVNS